MKKKVALIGAGMMAEEYIKTLKFFKDIELSGIISRSGKNAKKLSVKYKIQYYGNKIDELIKITKPDIIVVCCSILETFSVAKKLQNINKIILFEKPLGINLFETKKIFKILSNNKKNIFISLNRRFYENFKFVKKILNKESNSKRFIIINDQENIFAAKKNGHKDRVIKNWMFANSIHLIDLINYLCRGSEYKIKKFNKYDSKKEIVSATMSFKSGDLVVYNALWNRPGPWEVIISTKNYFFKFLPLEKLFYKKKYQKDYKTFKCNNKYKPGLLNLLKNVVSFSKTGKVKSLVRMEEYLKTAKLINKIYS